MANVLDALYQQNDLAWLLERKEAYDRLNRGMEQYSLPFASKIAQREDGVFFAESSETPA